MLQEMSSKTVIVCIRKAWETLQMVKLIMVTSYNTTAYLPIVRERVRNIPGWHCAGLLRGPLRKEGSISLSCQPLWELPRTEESHLARVNCPRRRPAGENGWMAPWFPSRTAGQLWRDTSLLQTSAEAAEASGETASQPSFFSSLLQSAPHLSRVPSGDHSPTYSLWVNK